MNDNFFYDIDEILRALDHYQGDPFFSQQYAALLQEQISKGLDLLLKKDIPSKSMLFRYLILPSVFIQSAKTSTIFTNTTLVSIPKLPVQAGISGS